MKKAIGLMATLLFLLVGLELSAQVVTGRLDLGRRDPLPEFIEYVSADGGLVTFGNMSRKSSRYLGVTKYDDLFNRQWSKQVLMQNGRANVDLMTVLGEDVFVFISEYIPRKRTIETSFTHLDLQGNILSDRQLISEISNEPEHRVDLKYVRSINKKKLLCYKNFDNASKSEKIQYYLFDADNDEIIQGEIQIPYPDDKFQVRKITISNEGKIYLLGKFYMVNRVKNPEDYGFKLYKFDPGRPEGMSVDIDMGELYITDLVMKVDPNENVFLAGFYSHNTTDQIIGTVFYRVNSNLVAEAQSTQRFPDEFLNQFLNERQIDKGRELRNFFLDNIILRSDGGMLLIAEKYYTTYNSYMDMYGYWVDQRVHHYDDIVISSVAANGDLEWTTVAPKRQSSEVRDHLSYLDVVSGPYLFLIYGYQPRRAARTIYVNEVTMEGGVDQRKILLDNHSLDDSFYPRLSTQISNTEALLVFYQEKAKVYSIARVEF